jgi:hypothetical protein
MTRVVLVYPYFHPGNDNSIFRFPPLGLGYIAACLRERGVEVTIVDCTFLERAQATAAIKSYEPTVIGFYSMFSLKKMSLEMART